MCDTLYKKTKTGYIFGKNSDRSPNEPNLVLFFPRRKTKETKLMCTYIKIPQVPETCAVLLVKPSWMWGAEMGINEYGVVIGNEAVFTKNKDKKQERLLGMDLLRLGLERGKSAKEALKIIISLLEEFGQGGNCGFDKFFYYDNSFLIADDEEAYVLETSGKDWVFKKIDDHYNISNRLSLNENHTASSGDGKGFASKNSDFLFTYFSGSKLRQKSGCDCLAKVDFGLEDMFSALRRHHPKDEKKLYTKGSVRSVCMHKTFLGDHTTGSMVVERRGKERFIWITGSSAPCLSLFKPVAFGVLEAPVFGESEASLNYWLDREWLQRAIYAGLVDEEEYRRGLIELEENFLEEAKRFEDASKPDYLEFVRRASKKEKEFIERYRREIELLKNDIDALPRLWRKLTGRLGKNLFTGMRH